LTRVFRMTHQEGGVESNVTPVLNSIFKLNM
jgi:hypothetical protein